jgi:DNA polymerase/3'-5' exonuclease PolX
MNSTTIFEYIQELEKRNEQLKELYRKSEATLEKLNSKILDESIQRVGAVLNEPSLYETTARTKTHTLNKEIAEHLRELGEMTSDFYKAGAYNAAADIIATLDFEVQNGESLLKIKGIGKGIASKVDQFLEEHFDDSESVASNEGQLLEDSDDEFFISYNHEIVDIFDKLASLEDDPHKRNAYRTVGDALHDLPYKVTNGKELAKGPKKVKGVGKSAAKIIDEFLETGKVKKLGNEKTSSYHISDMLYECASKAGDDFRRRAYENAADTIYNLNYKIRNGKEAMKIPGIGKSIAKKIDEFLETH